MDYVISEWLNLLLRWLHVVAGVFWIGQTALFAWLDHRMSVAERQGSPQVWMVHSGGFYRVQKQAVQAPLPPVIHWFQWEAALTWVSGFSLLVVVYYLGGAMFVPDGIGTGTGIALSVGLLGVGWLIYDGIWRSALAPHEGLAGALCLALVVAFAWALTQVFTGRGAYLEVGAMIGTVMAANVWIRILPPQRRMIAAAAAGEPVDATWSQGAKLRSKHNTFLALPLILIMLSNHFPVTTYGHRYNWLMLGLFLVAGIGARRLLNWHERRR